MTSPYALFRLMWRPLAVASVWLVLMGSSWPLLRLEDFEGGPLLALWNNGSDPLVRSAAWQLGVLFPFFAGVVALVRADLSGTALGWTLPGVRRGLVAGTVLIGLGVAVLVGVLLERGGPVPAGMAGAGLAFFWFLVPGSLFLSGWPKGWARAALLVPALAIFWPARYGALVSASPLLIGAVAGILAVVLLRDQFSAPTARRQTRLLDGGWKLLEGGPWSRLMGERAEWSISLAHSRLEPWVSAMAFEAGSGSRLRYVRGVAVGALIFAGYTLLMGRSGQAAVIVGAIASSGRLRLNSGLAYPLSRRRRAAVAYVGAVLNMALLLGGITALIPLIGLLPVPESWFILETSNSIPWLPGAATTWLLLPLVLWPAIVAPPERAGAVVFDLARRIGPLTLYILLMGVGLNLVPWLLERVDGMLVLGLWVVGSLLSYRILWWATQRRYASMDLSAQGP